MVWPSRQRRGDFRGVSQSYTCRSENCRWAIASRRGCVAIGLGDRSAPGALLAGWTASIDFGHLSRVARDLSADLQRGRRNPTQLAACPQPKWPCCGGPLMRRWLAPPVIRVYPGSKPVILSRLSLAPRPSSAVTRSIYLSTLAAIAVVATLSMVIYRSAVEVAVAQHSSQQLAMVRTAAVGVQARSRR